MSRFIQAESASGRENRAAGLDQIGGRLARKTLCFKPFQSNSNRFKPKKSENRFPSNPGLYRLLPPVTAHYGLLPPKNARRDFPPSTGLSGAYRQSTAPVGSYRHPKNVKTRSFPYPWSFLIGTSLELGTWSLELLLSTAPAKLRHFCTWLHLLAVSCALARRNKKFPKWCNRSRRGKEADSFQSCSCSCSCSRPCFFGVIRCCLVLFGAVWC